MDLSSLSKPEVKKRIRELRKEIVTVVQAKDSVALKKLRRTSKRLKRRARQLASQKTAEPAEASTPESAQGSSSS